MRTDRERARHHHDVESLADEYWQYHRATAQVWNIDRGDVEHIEEWEDLTSAGVRARVERLQEFERRGRDLADHLADHLADGRDETMADAVAFSARATAATLPYVRDVGLVAGSVDIVALLTVMVPAYTLTTAEHGHGYLRKLEAVARFVDGWIDGLRDGALGHGRCASARGIARSIQHIDDLLAIPAADDPTTRQAPPTAVSERDAAAWRGEVVDAVRQHVRPALEHLRHVLHDELLPVGRDDDHAGICHAPGGEADYQELLHAATSTSLDAESIHQLGRDQLARLDEEYARLGAEVLGIDDPAQIRARLRDDPTLRYQHADELLADATAIVARASAEAGRWFARLPTSACSVVPVTGGGMAFYTAPSPDGARGGTCFVNVSDPAVWTRFSLEPTIFHESIPGHHLQIAIAQELDLHPVLGELEVTSFEEGWGLYAERLADEMSLYSGPLQRLGMLTLDSLRAARLVVDTGVHAMGWTRDAAIDTLLGSTALVRPIVESEVDRYLADPGQATSYMVGRLEIERLRREAESNLGPRFRLGDFHETVLANGMTPLPGLGRTVRAWTTSMASVSEPG